MIVLDNVSYIYNKGRPDETQALSGISLEIPDGAITAVIGSTGSGKSTLVQLLNGIERPSGGRITVNGVDITDKKTDMRALRFKVGIVFQYPEQQLFEETVAEDIAFGPKNMGLDPAEVERRVKTAAELVGLDEKYMDRSPFELSGGQKRRAAIAGVLAMEPEVIVFDEPAAGLDPAGRKSVFGLIERLHGKRPDMTVIFVSHSMEDVARAADNVIVMDGGRIVMQGSTADVFRHGDMLEKAGLDVPQITKLCAGLRKRGFELPEDMYTPEEAAEYLTRILINA